MPLQCLSERIGNGNWRGGVRDDTGHDSLVVTEQENAERHEDAREVAVKSSVHATPAAANRTHISFFPCNPWIREGPSLGAMMAARIRSALEMERGPGLGMSMSSNLRPLDFSLKRVWDS